MRIVQQWMPAALSLVLGACANVETAAESHDVAAQSAALSNDRSAEAHTFLVKRDLKRCAFPRCGGFYVTKANHDKLTCADGKRANECYVASIEFANGLTADDGDLVRGTFTLKNFGEKGFDFGVLEGTAALSPAISEGLGKPAGFFYAPYDTGVRCIRTPCRSMGVFALNTDLSGDLPGVVFSRKTASEKSTLETAFFARMSASLDAAKANPETVVVGKFKERYDSVSRKDVWELNVTNVFSAKVAEQRKCVVHDEGNTTTAWNVASVDEAKTLTANLPGNVKVLEGRCSEIATPCIMLYRPVHGIIDAHGETCSEESNACFFRGAVIAAAGLDGKANGSYQEGPCASEVACESDDDCTDGFCGWTAEDTRVCKAFAQEGEHCEGFVVPEARTFCRPDLKCAFVDPTFDAGGTCQAAK